MALTVTTNNAQYQFDGPHTNTGNLNAHSGVYVITTKGPTGEHKVLDVGESHNVWHRVSNHDRKGEWTRHMQDGLFASVYYCDERARMLLESELRLFFDPPCGER